MCGATPVIATCGADSGFKLTPELLRESITSKTRWLILNSPSNPTGAVYSQPELAALANVLLEYPDVLVLSDDIYEHLIFDGAPFHTIASVEPRLRSRTVTMNGVSKAYAMTGWRIGYATGPRWLLQAMEKLQGQQTSGACSISQHAALAALRGPQEFIEQARSVFQRRRDSTISTLNAIPAISCDTPKGAFYVFASCAAMIGKRSAGGKLLESDEDVATALLDEVGVGVVPGSAFGLGPYIRIAYAIDDESLARACSLMADFCSSLS
jgi:aspartate aminotransferase